MSDEFSGTNQFMAFPLFSNIISPSERLVRNVPVDLWPSDFKKIVKNASQEILFHVVYEKLECVLIKNENSIHVMLFIRISS